MDIRRHLRHLTYFICGLALTGGLSGLQLSEAATYYVATTGNDANSGTESNPFRTINRGVKGLKAGDTLNVKAGTYAERISNVPSGSSSSNQVIIKAEQQGSVILRPSGSGFIVFFDTTARYITLDGLKLDGSNLPKGVEYGAIKINGEGPLSGGSHITIRNTEITNILYDSCTSVEGSFNVFSNVKISNCRGQESGTGSHGIYWASRDGLLEQVEVVNTSGMGIQLYFSKNNNSVVNNLIRNSIFRDADRHGIWIGGRSNKIYNSVLTQNGKNGIVIRNNNNIIRNNIIYGNGGQPYDNGGGDTVLSNNITSDPRFMNPSAGDFNLHSDSPAIDKGATLNEVRDDFNKVARPQGNGYDIGAYEFKKSLPAPTNLKITAEQ